MSKKIITKLILVEGKDDEKFFQELCNTIKNNKNELYDIRGVDGDGAFKNRKLVIGILKQPNFIDIKTLLIIRDADKNFKSVKESTVGLIAEIKECLPSIASIKYYILPDNKNKGMLETFLIKILEENKKNKFANCVKNFGEEIEKIKEYDKHYLPKLKMFSYLYSATNGNRGIKDALESDKENKLKNLLFNNANSSLNALKKILFDFLS